MLTEVEGGGRSEFVVTKRTEPVVVFFRHRSAVEEAGELSLSLTSRSGTGEETVAEYLEHSERFIPLRFRPFQPAVLVNTDDIVYVRSRRDDQPKGGKMMKVRFSNGVEIFVEHQTTLPDAKARILDYLNGPQRFLRFLTEGVEIFINKDHVMEVTEHE